MTKLRIAVVNSHPIQYFAPLYAYLNSLDHFEITALYLSDFSIRGGLDHGFGAAVRWDIDLLSGYNYQFVGHQPKSRSAGGGFWSMTEPEIWATVRKGQFDALWLHGHAYASDMIAFAAARSIGTKILMRCETHLGLPRSTARKVLRRIALGTLYSQIDRFLAIGSANREFYQAMGTNPDHIFLVPYAVDNQRFISRSRLDALERRAMRASLGVDDDAPIILYASKLQKRKHPDDLIRAAKLLAERGARCHVAMVGSGEMEAELYSLVQSLEVPRVHFVGFVNQEALPRIYGSSDVFVLPSDSEPWGLVVNEAMCAGLVIVVSNEIGCVPDLVKDGKNGRLFQAGDWRALADCLLPIINDGQLRAAMSASSLQIIQGWDFGQCAKGLKAAMDSLSGATGTSPRLSSPFSRQGV